MIKSVPVSGPDACGVLKRLYLRAETSTAGALAHDERVNGWQTMANLSCPTSQANARRCHSGLMRRGGVGGGKRHGHAGGSLAVQPPGAPHDAPAEPPRRPPAWQ